MNKLFPIVIVIAVIGIAVYTFKSSPTNQEGTSETETSSSNTPSAESVNTSLEKLMAQGKSLQCSVSSTENGQTTTGTLFISGKNVRGDFKTDTATQKGIDSHMIVGDESVYAWSSAAPEGIKLPVAGIKTGQVQGGIDYAKEKPYSCSPWTADASKFQAPSEIRFTDLGTAIKNSQNR